MVVAAILGWRSGAIPQVLGLLGAILAGAAVLYALPLLSEPLDGIDPVFRPLVVLAALIGAVALGESVGANIGSSLARRLGNGLLGAADRTMGAGFGAVQALLIVWLAGSLLAEGPVPRLAETAGGSTAVRTMTAILPPPTEIAVGLGGWLDDRGLPDVFVGFEPLPGPPVDRPADPAARAIAKVAEASTLKVSAATCSLSSVGTGFVVAYDYVVTNAHVVAGAGARGVRVTAPGGRVLDAIPVLFDPDLDVALLHVDRLAAPPLAFAPKDPGRGAIGAALGYPGGGALTIVPAAVSGPFRGHRPRHLRRLEGATPGPRAARRDRSRRQRRPVHPGRRHGRWRRLRRGEDQRGRRLRPVGEGGRDTHQTRARSHRRGRHRRVRAHLATGDRAPSHPARPPAARVGLTRAAANP